MRNSKNEDHEKVHIPDSIKEVVMKYITIAVSNVVLIMNQVALVFFFML